VISVLSAFGYMIVSASRKHLEALRVVVTLPADRRAWRTAWMTWSGRSKDEIVSYLDRTA